MGKIIDKLEDLFIVGRKEKTYTKIFVALIVLVMIWLSLPMYFKYENYVYEKYSEEYKYVSEIVEVYKMKMESIL